MNGLRVSIVMPVWNAGRFLARTLDSVLAQTCGDFELICTDDGSTDNSLEVLHDYALRDRRIRVIAAEHAGACVTLNRCLDEAHGEYVAFLDNDDWLHPEALQTAVSAISSTDSDVLFFDWRPVSDGGSIRVPEFPALPKRLAPQPICDPIGWSLKDRRGFVTHVLLGARLHRRSAIGGIRFDPEYTFGDVLFYWKLMSKQGLRAAYLPVPLYFYAERTGSIIHSPLTEKKARDRACAIRKIDDILLRENPGERQRVMREMYPGIAWTAFKDAHRDGAHLKLVCRCIEEDLLSGRLRWRDFGLRGINKAMRIRRALASIRSQEEART